MADRDIIHPDIKRYMKNLRLRGFTVEIDGEHLVFCKNPEHKHRIRLQALIYAFEHSSVKIIR